MVLKKNNNSIILKKETVILEKKFLKKIDLNEYTTKINTFLDKEIFFSSVLTSTNNINIKTDLYLLLKLLKKLKREHLKSLEEINTLEKAKFCNKLQKSYIFASNVENMKNVKSKAVTLLLLKALSSKVLNTYQFSDLSSTLENNNQKRTLKGYTAYNKRFKFFNAKQLKLLFSFLKAKRFLNKLFETRSFLVNTSKKKKYRNLTSFFKRNRVKLQVLLNVYRLSYLKYSQAKKSAHKLYKKLVWKRKKRKKWKKNNLFRFFRSRHRLLYKFYIPKHVEINYKTFNFIYLESTNITTVNSKVTFWLNLRRLLTFMAF